MIHVIAYSCDNAFLSRKVKHDITFNVNLNGLGLCNLQLYQNYYLEYQTSPPCNLYHMLTAFPQCNFLLEFPEIIYAYHGLIVSGISKIMHCGILIDMQLIDRHLSKKKRPGHACT